MFKFSQDLSQSVCERLRSNADHILDQLADEKERAESANGVRPNVLEHEATVKEYINKTINTAATSYVSSLVSERMNQLAIDVITHLTDSSIAKLQEILRQRRTVPKMLEATSAPSKENIGIVSRKSQAKLVSAQKGSNTQEEHESNWRHSRTPFTIDHAEDEVRNEDPLDLSLRATDSRSKSTKPLVHLTKDRPKVQVHKITTLY
jgi:hypothetical protein